MPPGSPHSALFWWVRWNSLLFLKSGQYVNSWKVTSEIILMHKNMNASDTVKSTQSPHLHWCAVVAFDSELNIHQARLTPHTREMPLFLTPGNSFIAYSWNHLTTLDLSGLPNTHLQHLGHMLTSEKKKEHNSHVQMCTPLGKHPGSQGREGLTAVEAMLKWMRGKTWFRVKAYKPSSTHWVWVGAQGLCGSESAWLCWGSLLYM